MTTAAAGTQHAHFDWTGLWILLAGADDSMAMTIIVKNRRRTTQQLTGLILGQPPRRWRRLWPRRWWHGLKGPKLFDLDVGDQALEPIPSHASKKLGPLPMRRLDGMANDSLPSNVRVLAYCGTGRPYVRVPRKR